MGSDTSGSAPARDTHGNPVGLQIDLGGVEPNKAFAAGRALESLVNHLNVARTARHHMRLPLAHLAVTPQLCQMVSKVANQLASVQTLLDEIQLAILNAGVPPAISSPAERESAEQPASEPNPT